MILALDYVWDFIEGLARVNKWQIGLKDKIGREVILVNMVAFEFSEGFA